MSQTISGRVLTIVASVVVLLAAGFGASWMLIRSSADDPLRLNLAARQRMLTQKLTKELLLFERSAPEERPARARAVTAASEVFARTLAAFESGGGAPLDLEQSLLVSLEPVADARGRAALLNIDQVWRPLRLDVDAVLADGSQLSQIVARVIAREPALMAACDELVDSIQQHTEGNARTALLVQGVLLALGLLFAVVGIQLLRHGVTLPLMRLNAAAQQVSLGAADVTVSTDGPREVVELAESVERLRLALRAMLNDDAAEAPDEGFDEL